MTKDELEIKILDLEAEREQLKKLLHSSDSLVKEQKKLIQDYKKIADCTHPRRVAYKITDDESKAAVHCLDCPLVRMVPRNQVNIPLKSMNEENH